MAKRFTDTEKYKDPWFRRLHPKLKTLFYFMCDDCNHAGVWKENFDMFEMFFKIKVTHDDMKEFGDKIIRLDNDTYFLTSFIKFQYGTLNKANNAHQGVLKSLNYNNIETSPYLAPAKPLPSPCPGAQDKEEDKDMDKEKDRDREPERTVQLSGPKTDDFLNLWNTELVPLGCKHAPLTLSPNAAMDYFKVKKLLEKNSMSVADYVEKIKQCDFLLRKKKGGLNITFALNEDNCFKIISGAYEEPEMSDEEAVAKFHSLLTGGM